MVIKFIRFGQKSALIGYALLSTVCWPTLTAMGQVLSPPTIFQCGTENISPAVRQALESEAALALRLKQASGAAFATLTYVPIRPHIIRKADGTGGYSMASLNNVMALTNKYYLQNGNGIQFYFSGTTPDYINNDALYAQYRQSVDDATVAPNDVSNALNQYYVNQFDNTSLGGYAQFPNNSVASTRTIILNENWDDDMGNRLVPHELGHTFNLLHTFESAYGYELVTRGTGANCTTAGDLVCDTPADPYGRFSGATSSCVSGCPPTFTCSFVDTQNNTYAPSPTNIMSYYFPCVHDFTSGQYDRMQAGLALRQSHTAYTLNAPATVMTAPSNVSAVVQGNSILITWQDNASNEMGYFIERSTSPTSGFVPIGGVAPNVTTFTDASFTSRVRYYYRVKGSNTTTGSISPTATILTPDCRPSFTNDGCPYGIVINSVSVNGAVLSQNSGCSPSSSSYYTSFTAVSGTVTAGQSASVSVSKGNYNAMGVTAWVDLNNNGQFESSELLYQTPTTNTLATVSGTITIPSTTTASTVTMRVVTAFATVPGDACGSYGYGETEDYLLVVKPPCVAPVATLSGTTTITAGQTTTLVTSFTGTAPYSLTVNVSAGTPLSFTGIAASPFSFTVAPMTSTTYTLGRVASSCTTVAGSGTVIVTVNPCTILYTLKVGNWNDPTVWSCNRIPAPTDPVQIGHLITIPASVVARASQLTYLSGGALTISSTGQLVLTP